MLEKNDKVERVERNPRDDYVPLKSAGLKQFIPTALVSALVCGAIIFTGIIPSVYVTKNDFESNIKSVAGDVVSAKASATEAMNKANTASQSIGSLTTRVDNAATQASVTAVQTSVNNLKIPDGTALNGQISALSAKVDSLTKQITDDQSKITALQTQVTTMNATLTTGTGGTTTTTGQVKATFSTSNWVPTYYTPTAASPTFQLPFKLNITNGLNKQITNLQLYVSMYASGTVAGATGVSLQSLSGGTWTTYTASGNTFYFTNSSGMSSWGGTGLTLAAGSSQTITLIFNFTAPAAAYGTMISFSPDIATIGANDYTIS